MIRMPKPSAKGPQSGARTHHQDQVITLQSFRVMKINPKIPKKGKELLVVVLMSAMIENIYGFVLRPE